jgi:hypothetical protein
VSAREASHNRNEEFKGSFQNKSRGGFARKLVSPGLTTPLPGEGISLQNQNRERENSSRVASIARKERSPSRQIKNPAAEPSKEKQAAPAFSLKAEKAKAQ